MRVPLSWLAEYVDLLPGSTPEDVHAALVKVGLEEEAIHRFEVTGPVVVGQVLEFVEEPQSNGKTIRWCQVDVGEANGGVRGIVCGAHNFAAGDKVAVTLPGAVLPGPFPIAARKTYGHTSDGMIASGRELGLNDEHAGILVLATLGLDPEIGADAIALLGLDDAAVEVNVTPDRGYAFSIRGIAREYSHATGAVFRDPVDQVQSDAAADGFPLAISDDAPIRGNVGASVFVARTVEGVDPTRPTPPWLAARLRLAGIRSLTLPVDITNYVMLEFGQPIHGYDLDKLAGGITVRRAQPGETLETLDGAVRKLDPEDLLIADESGAIGLAGVMGGAKTEMSDTTTRVLVEAANFDPVSIARTARRQKLPSEASRRFERGVDPAVAEAAAARVVQLLEQLAGGHAVALGARIHNESAPQPIELPSGFATRLVGVDYDDAEIERTLTAIGASVVKADAGFTVTPPSWRPDLTDAATLAEEVARVGGYERIPSVIPVAPPGRGLTREQQLRRQAAWALAGSGLTEVLAMPFLTAEQNNAFGSPSGEPVPAVKLANALDARVPFLRTTLLPGLIDIAQRNLSRGLTDLAVYELGLVFRPEAGVSYGVDRLPIGNARPDDATLAALDASIPPQPRHVAGLFLGNATPKQPGHPAVATGLADALAAVRTLGAAVGVEISVRQGRHASLHPGRTAELFVATADGEASVGFAGELLPALAAELDLPRIVAVFEADLGALIAASPETLEVAPISSFPAATQDLSLVVPLAAAAGEVLAAVVEGAGELLEHAQVVDDYRGQGVPAGCKSLTFALRFRAGDRTLTASEASDAKLAGAALAGDRFGATVRE
ncbi:phenylalanine--tRNA ligase subunit beta [Gryllotalpicola protaetiae]|uniref:Phenylalanine--tRNA ligase beta subunit n=1 Tax=Gryllotalpicola protaetiae TaxID=2419771 RepID=A0A387C221_9MICO|nr:phenylalanine--tRNA ligase subunit beta [Gryllotalpicola protaetiae]AYG04561.1 phenylalanine--tRNA ligase subunit beta [Gryllotalpicola protaetiae]